MYREMMNSFEVSDITQGSIFNYAYSDRYPDNEILGLIITARCDIENKKNRIYNYLPVIPYQIWVKNELFEILKKRKLKDIESNFLKKIETLNYTKNTIETFGLEDVIRKIESMEIKGKDNIINAAHKLKILTCDALTSESIEQFTKDIEKINKELIENKLSDYFFIDQIKDYGSCIVNLREIHHFDKKLAEIISSGFDFETATSQEIDNLRAIRNIDNGIVQLLGVMKSPYIELLMQRFSELFSRIGVDNPSKGLPSELTSTIKDL